LAAALSLVVHLVRDRSGRRRVAEIHVLERGGGGLVTTVPALVGTERGPGWAHLTALCKRGLTTPETAPNRPAAWRPR
jgi:pilus assembly protein CpaF